MAPGLNTVLAQDTVLLPADASHIVQVSGIWRLITFSPFFKETTNLTETHLPLKSNYSRFIGRLPRPSMPKFSLEVHHQLPFGKLRNI